MKKNQWIELSKESTKAVFAREDHLCKGLFEVVELNILSSTKIEAVRAVVDIEDK